VFRDPWRLQTSRTSPVDHGLVREGAAHPSVGDSIAPELTDWSRVLRLPTHLARITTRLVLGYTTEAIAASEKLSISTVRTYIKNLYRITGVSTRSQLIALVVHTAASAHEAVQYPPAR
jgi:DNA-binding CsgD family transcriptional regulator